MHFVCLREANIPYSFTESVFERMSFRHPLRHDHGFAMPAWQLMFRHSRLVECNVFEAWSCTVGQNEERRQQLKLLEERVRRRQVYTSEIPSSALITPVPLSSSYVHERFYVFEMNCGEVSYDSKDC